MARAVVAALTLVVVAVSGKPRHETTFLFLSTFGYREKICNQIYSECDQKAMIIRHIMFNQEEAVEEISFESLHFDLMVMK